MLVELTEWDHAPLVVLPVHFDTQLHYIPLVLFSDTGFQIEKLATELGKAFFGEDFSLELVVLPPRDGTFTSRLGFWIKKRWFVPAAVFGFLETGQGAALWTGLFSQPPEYFWKIVGKYIHDTAIESWSDYEHFRSTHEADADRLTCEALVAEATRIFMEAETDDLAAAGITPRDYREAFEARNDFLAACASESTIKGVGFDETPNFPIDRGDFASLQVKLPPKDDDDAEPWIVEISKIKVSSPNWDRSDHLRRQWKGQDKAHDRYFVIEDEEFWRKVRDGSLRPTVVDEMTVQWAFQIDIKGKKKNFRVLRVLEFNLDVLSEPLNNVALSAILGHFDKPSDPHYQGDLFGDFR